MASLGHERSQHLSQHGVWLDDKHLGDLLADWTPNRRDDKRAGVLDGDSSGPVGCVHQLIGRTAVAGEYRDAGSALAVVESKAL